MRSPFKEARSELERGMRLSKCRKCGCMHGTLKNLKAALHSLGKKDADELLNDVNKWIGELEPLKYECFECKYCIPPEAMSILTSRFPSLVSSTLSSCEFDERSESWPPVAGEYTVVDKTAPVAVSTLASVRLEERLTKLRPAGLCIIGKTETENIGIDKLVKNVITNPAISFLIVAGKDSEGHRSGKTILALWENGVDGDMRIIGSPGRRPVLKNISRKDVEIFRRQVQVDDQLGCEDIKILAKRVKELSQKAAPVRQDKKSLPVFLTPESRGTSSCECSSSCCDKPVKTELKTPVPPPKIKAKKTSPKSIKLDRAGYFVIIPSKKDKLITVEHYSYDNKHLRTIEGDNSRDIYLTIINNKWISDLNHAAYIGKELARAELSIKKGFKFIQDGA